MNKLIESKAEDDGICCTSCQEDVNVHRCKKCFQRFEDGDDIYCEPHSQTDCEHYHKDCKPK